MGTDELNNTQAKSACTLYECGLTAFREIMTSSIPKFATR